MSVYSDTFWQLRLDQCAESLKKNNFEVYCAADPFQAARIFKDEIFAKIEVNSASWGDSLSLRATGILDILIHDSKIEFIETFLAAATVSRLLAVRNVVFGTFF